MFKPAEATVSTALSLAQVLTQAGLPDGLFNVVLGDSETGKLITQHKGIAKVSLTGDPGTGKKVYAKAAETLKHVTLELGGKSPLVIFPDADLTNAVSGAMMANFYSNGEVCSNAARVYVHSDIHEAFVNEVERRTRAIKLGDPQDEQVQPNA